MINFFLGLLFSISFVNDIKLPFNNNSTVIYEGSHPAHKWKGVSSDVKGGIICDSSDCVIQVIVPLESFDSGSSGRDSNMLFTTESHKYPYVKYYSDPFSIEFIKNKQSSIVLSGYIEFHDIKKDMETNITINYQDSVLLGTSSFSISLDDYRIDKPQLLFIPISDEINLTCNLYCENIFSKLE